MRLHATLAILLLCACSSPDADEVFGGSGAASSAAASTGGSGGDGGARAGGGGPATTGMGPASTGATVASSSASGTSCDADGDRSLASGACGGDDCDDADADVHPGQLAFFTQPRDGGSFDYDCDGTIEKEHPVVDCSGAVCVANQGKQGFEADVVCGVEADLGTCGGIPCGFVPGSAAKQGCR